MPSAAFGPFSFNDETLELRRENVVVPLEPQPARLLALLISQQGQVVTRGQIVERLWPCGTHVNFTESLHYCVRRIRIALADDSKHPAYVQTLPRLGYRFVATVNRPVAVRPRKWRYALAAGAAVVVGVIAMESRPNTHHELAVRVVSAVHKLVF